MKTINIIVVLCLVLASTKSHASIVGFNQTSIDFTNAADAQAKATWSDPEKITVSKEGLGWDGNEAASRGGWIQTKPLALGLSWRPVSGISIRALIEPPPREFTFGNGQKSTGDAGDMYVRYSPDLKHWSTWQALQRAEPQSSEEKKKPGRYYRGTIGIPQRERGEYSQLLSEYSRLDVPWKSDEEAAVNWILHRDPDFFARQIPFIGYAEFLFEGDFRGSQRFQALRADISYGVGGMHSMPKDMAMYRNRDVPWRFEGGKASKAEPGGPVKPER